MRDYFLQYLRTFRSVFVCIFQVHFARMSVTIIIFSISLTFTTVEANAACTVNSPKLCSAWWLCSISTKPVGQSGRRAWRDTEGDYYQVFIREARRRGMQCGVGPKRKTYLQRCKVTVSQVKAAQKQLKELELYPYKIDGVAGKGTIAAIAKAKKIVGDAASAGECLTAKDVKAFDQLLAAKECSPANLDQCSRDAVCNRATIDSNGIRRWNFDELAYVNHAKERSLDCNITIDNTPFSEAEAVEFLSSLVDFVEENSGSFDLKFAREFDNVRPITQGDWSNSLSADFERFREYATKFPAFQKYLANLRSVNDEAQQKRIEQLRASLTQDMKILKEWAKANLLDAKAAQIAELNANFGDEALQTVIGLEQLLSSAKKLLLATGVDDGAVKEATQQQIDSLYEPSTVYIFANTSGNARNLYKSLEGNFIFEQTMGTYCSSNKLDAFDRYLLREKLFLTFDHVASFSNECSATTDVFIAKGNDLSSDTLFSLIPLNGLTQVFELPKSDRSKVYDQLTFLKDAIKKDVLDGTRIGFGLLKTGARASKVCAIIEGQNYGHQQQLNQFKLLMSAYDVDWNGLENVTSDPEEAFKLLQRGQCDAIYAGSLNLGRLYLSADVADISLEFLPLWISNSAIEVSQQAYEEKTAETAQANAAAEQSLDDKSKLDEQAQRSRAETAAVRQQKMREQNGLRFMALKDELRDQVFTASDFGFNNAPEELGYIKKYLKQPFVDQATRYSPFDAIIVDMQNLAAERWEVTEQRLEQVDYGEAKFNGRLVDALQVELKIASKNRLVGKYSEYCRRVHAVKDVDFDMWRNISITECLDTSATQQWKLENAFKSKWIVKPN